MHQLIEIPANVFWASYIAWGVMELWIMSRDSRGFRGRTADQGSFLGFVVCIPLALVLAFNAMIHLPQLHIAVLQPGLTWVGIAMIWAGMAFRLWAVLTLGALFRTSVVVQEGHRLVTAGPYRWLRHPAYTGTIVTTVGLGLAFANWGALAAMAVLPTLAIAFRMHVEERALADEFGAAYADFGANRSAVIPCVW